MSKKILSALNGAQAGDLITVEWFDASVGRSLSSGTTVDIPVRSWGVFIAILGEKRKHIVIAQNSFRYTDSVYDVDYTSIPISWTVNLTIIKKGEVSPDIAERLLQSFLAGRCRTIKKRTRNHEMG